METVALGLAAVGAIVFIAVGISALLLQARISRLVERAGQALDSDVRTALAAWTEAARGVQRAVAKLEQGAGALNRSLERVDRVAKTVEADLHALSAVQPLISRMGAWLTGMRKGMSGIAGRRARAGTEAGGADTEAG